MDKRTRGYTILGSILIVGFIAIRILKYIGVTALPMWLNILGTTAFGAPMITILYMLGGDRRIRKGWRIFCRFLSGWCCLCFAAGLVLELFGF